MSAAKSGTVNSTAKKLEQVAPKCRRRHRLTRVETDLLEAEYTKDPNWTQARTQELVVKFGLGRLKLYKWHYDRRRKD